PWIASSGGRNRCGRSSGSGRSGPSCSRGGRTTLRIRSGSFRLLGAGARLGGPAVDLPVGAPVGPLCVEGLGLQHRAIAVLDACLVVLVHVSVAAHTNSF